MAGLVWQLDRSTCRVHDLGKLERRAELVKSEVISTAEAATADHQTTPIAEHFDVYLDYLRAKETSPVRVANMQRQFDRVSSDCDFRRLADLDGGKLTKWLLQREAEDMSAATRNGYRETLVMFANWCCSGMRHSSVDLTMNVYTDPKLLDVHGALDSLPSLDLNSTPATERQMMRATGTDDRDAMPDERHAVNSVAPNTGERGQTVSFAVHSPSDDHDSAARTGLEENPKKPSKKALLTVFASKASDIGMTGFEPAASTSRT